MNLISKQLKKDKRLESLIIQVSLTYVFHFINIYRFRYTCINNYNIENEHKLFF